MCVCSNCQEAGATERSTKLSAVENKKKSDRTKWNITKPNRKVDLIFQPGVSYDISLCLPSGCLISMQEINGINSNILTLNGINTNIFLWLTLDNFTCLKDSFRWKRVKRDAKQSKFKKKTKTKNKTKKHNLATGWKGTEVHNHTPFK